MNRMKQCINCQEGLVLNQARKKVMCPLCLGTNVMPEELIFYCSDLPYSKPLWLKAIPTQIVTKTLSQGWKCYIQISDLEIEENLCGGYWILDNLKRWLEFEGFSDVCHLSPYLDDNEVF